MQSQKAIIIGSGIAGIASAIRLVMQGYNVRVYETNSYPGGKISRLEKDGFCFDAGPSLFTQPQNIEELFVLANEPIRDYFNYQKVDMACKYFFENGKIINGFTDAVLFANELKEKTGEQQVIVKKYLSGSKKLYKSIGSIFLNYSLHKRRTWMHRRVLKAIREVRFPYLFSTLAGYNKKYFSFPESVQLFNRYATYNGSDPYKAPGMLSLISHLEHNEGVFYPDGGMISIINALYNLAIKKGVQFYFNTPVERIIQHEGKVMGVVVKSENIAADIVVSNADIYFTYKNLLNHLPKAKKILSQERSSSALIFYWGINAQFPELDLHNIFFSSNYKEEFNCIFNKKLLSADPTVYINISAKIEAGHAPPGKENWFVMVNAPANYGQDWEQLKQQARVHVIEKLSRVLHRDIGSLIETEETMDPVLIEKRTSSYMGSIYGTSSNSRMAAFSRPANFTSYIKGLYFCGGTVHPGGGIPLCLKSAEITAGLIKNDFKKLT